MSPIHHILIKHCHENNIFASLAPYNITAYSLIILYISYIT